MWRMTVTRLCLPCTANPIALQNGRWNGALTKVTADKEWLISNATQADLGSVVSLWRYPVKSMMGEELNESEVTDLGLLGDRSYAVVDSADGKAASAKNRKVADAFRFSCWFSGTEWPQGGKRPVRIVLPRDNGHKRTSRCESGSLESVRCEVTLCAAEGGALVAEGYWPDMEGSPIATRSRVSQCQKERSSTQEWSIY